jgi:hypothetical protein
MPKIKDSTRSIIAKAADGATLTDDEMTELYCDAPGILDEADLASASLAALQGGINALRAALDTAARVAREAGRVEQANWMEGLGVALNAALAHAQRATGGLLGHLKESPTFCGFPQSADGTVQGALPDDATGADHSDALEDLGYQIHVVRAEPEDLDDEDDASDWLPDAPKGEGWTLAWKAQDEDGWNAVWWRPTAQQKLEKLATMVLGLGLVSSGGKVVKDFARECLGIDRVATGV